MLPQKQREFRALLSFGVTFARLHERACDKISFYSEQVLRVTISSIDPEGMNVKDDETEKILYHPRFK